MPGPIGRSKVFPCPRQERRHYNSNNLLVERHHHVTLESRSRPPKRHGPGQRTFDQGPPFVAGVRFELTTFGL